MSEATDFRTKLQNERYDRLNAFLAPYRLSVGEICDLHYTSGSTQDIGEWLFDLLTFTENFDFGASTFSNIKELVKTIEELHDEILYVTRIPTCEEIAQFNAKESV